VETKEGHFLIIPLIKKHLFDNPDYLTVDYILFQTQTLKLHPTKF